MRSMDVLRQQQEMIQKLTLAQQVAKQQAEAQRQQAAKQLEAVKQQAALQMAAGQVAGQLMTGQSGAMKTPPLPGMTTEALQASLNEQLTKMTTTLQRQQQAVTDALSKGGLTAGVAGVMIGQGQGAAEQMRAEMELLKSQIDALSNRQQQEMVQLQHPDEPVQGSLELGVEQSEDPTRYGGGDYSQPAVGSGVAGALHRHAATDQAGIEAVITG